MHLSLAAKRMRPPAARTHATHADSSPTLTTTKTTQCSLARVHTRVHARTYMRTLASSYRSYMYTNARVLDANNAHSSVFARSLARSHGVFLLLHLFTYVPIKECASQKRANARVREKEANANGRMTGPAKKTTRVFTRVALFRVISCEQNSWIPYYSRIFRYSSIINTAVIRRHVRYVEILKALSQCSIYVDTNFNEE